MEKDIGKRDNFLLYHYQEIHRFVDNKWILFILKLQGLLVVIVEFVVEIQKKRRDGFLC